MHSSFRPPQTMATVAAIFFSFFPVAVLALQFIQSGHYSPRGQAMSELALGKGGWLMTVAFVAMGMGMLLSAGLIRTLFPQAKTLRAFFLIAGTLDFVTAVFHTNGEGPATTGSTIHMFAGLASFLLVMFSMFISVRTFKRNAEWTTFARTTCVWVFITVPAFILTLLLQGDNFGIGQRTFVAAWLSWLIAFAIRAKKVTAKEY